MVKVLLIFYCAIGVVLTQDIMPEFPEDINTTTTTTVTEQVVVTTTTTEIPPTTVISATTAVPTITAVPTTTAIPTTTEQEILTTTTEAIKIPTSTEAQETTIATTPIPSATSTPSSWHPQGPNFPQPRCYYKVQQGYPYLKWINCRPRMAFPIECYHCCLYSYFSFAGCNKVDFNYCKNNEIAKY